jgi:hypothetical protein
VVHVNLLNKFATSALALGSLTIVSYAIYLASISVLITYIIIGSVGLSIVWRGGRSAISLFILAYGVVNLAAVFLYIIYIQRYGSPYFIGGSDDLMYENYAHLVAQTFWMHDPEDIKLLINVPGHNSIGYVYLLSLLIRFSEFFGGYNTMIPRILNAGILGLVAVLLSRIAMQIGLRKKDSLIAGIWVILFPMMFYSAAHVFRDTITLLILLSCLYLALAISTHRSKIFHPVWLIYSLPFPLLILMILEFRAFYAIPIISMLLSAWFFKIMPVVRLRLWHASFIFPAIVISWQLASETQIVTSAISTMTRYALKFELASRTGFDGLSQVLFNLPQPLQTFGRLGYALVTPLPVLYSKIEWNLLGMGALVQFYFSTFVILGMRLVYRCPRMLPIVFGFLIICFSYVMGTFTFRHSTQWFPFAILLGIIGYRHYWYYRKLVFLLCTFILGLSAISYLYLKA